MAAASFASRLPSGRRISLAKIDAAVSARLGPTRGLGQSQPSCFNRQVAMYLAKHAGPWSTTVIGRFYDGRDHSTVCHGIQRIEALRESDPDVDALLCGFERELGEAETLVVPAPTEKRQPAVRLCREDLEDLAELIAARVCAYLERDAGEREDTRQTPRP